MKFISHHLALVSAILVTFAVSATAMAQFRGTSSSVFGDSGFNGVTIVLTALVDSQAEELKLTDDQKIKIREVINKLRADWWKLDQESRCGAKN